MSKSILQPSVLGGVVHTLVVDSLTNVEKLRVQADGRAAEIRVEIVNGSLSSLSFTDCAEFDGEQDLLWDNDYGRDVVFSAVSPSPLNNRFLIKIPDGIGGWVRTISSPRVMRFTISSRRAEWSLWLAGTATVKVNGRML